MLHRKPEELGKSRRRSVHQSQNDTYRESSGRTLGSNSWVSIPILQCLRHFAEEVLPGILARANKPNEASQAAPFAFAFKVVSSQPQISQSRPLLGHLSSCVPSILRCFGSEYGQICKELPKHHKLLVLVLPMICKDSRYFRAACGVFTLNMQESEKTP